LAAKISLLTELTELRPGLNLADGLH